MPPLFLVEVCLHWKNVEVLKYYWNFNATLQFPYRNASTFLEWRYALTENIPPQFPYRNASTFLVWRYALTENVPPYFPYRNASTFFSGNMSSLKYGSTGKMWRY